MNYLKLREKRYRLIQKRQNTDHTHPECLKNLERDLRHKHSYLYCVAEQMALLLEDYARLLGHGEEYKKVCDSLEELNSYHEKTIKNMETGKEWGTQTIVRKSQKQTYTGNIFGLKQSEIAEMQGIKKLK